MTHNLIYTVNVDGTAYNFLTSKLANDFFIAAVEDAKDDVKGKITRSQSSIFHSFYDAYDTAVRDHLLDNKAEA